jgi:hypothetical protein
MTISFKLSQKDMRALSQTLTNRAKKRVGPAMANELKQVVIEHAEQGKDIMRRSFEPYKPAYAEFRKKLGLPTHPVNLRTNGKIPHAGPPLLDGQRVRGNKLFPGATSEIQEGLMKKRKFYPDQGVGIVKDDMQRLTRKAERTLENERF